MRTNSTFKLLRIIISVLFFRIVFFPISYAQNSSISVNPKEGFIFQLDPNNVQTSFQFTISNNEQNPVSLDLKVESADSTYILYVSEPDTNTYNGNIWKMRPDGSEKTQLTFDTLDYEAVWSPDGNNILFWSERSGIADIWVMDSDGSNLINLTDNPAYDYYPDYSADGQYIIFNSTRDNPYGEVYRMSSSGTDVERLTTNNFPEYRPRYSPDGQYFAAQIRNPDNNSEIYVFSIDGLGYTSTGTLNNINNFQPSWFPYGQRVVWTSGGEETEGSLNIVSAYQNSSEPRVEFATPGNDYYPRYSPDGQFLAFSKSTFYMTGGDEIFVWNKARDTLIQITDNTPVSREWGPEWSPFLGSPTWPSMNQNTIQIPAGDSANLDININASGLSLGWHTASIMIYNAENNLLLGAVPLNLDYVQELDVQTNVEQIKTYSLSQNYPNPFNPSTEINYEIPNSGFVTLNVYDELGNKVASLISEEKSAGSYGVEFDGSGLSSGIYFYQLRASSFTETKKMILLR